MIQRFLDAIESLDLYLWRYQFRHPKPKPMKIRFIVLAIAAVIAVAPLILGEIRVSETHTAFEPTQAVVRNNPVAEVVRLGGAASGEGVETSIAPSNSSVVQVRTSERGTHSSATATLKAAVSRSVKRPIFSGLASTYGPGYSGWLAVPHRWWIGQRIRICYRGTCVVRRANDYGPNQYIYPERIIDLDIATFETLCKCHWYVKGVFGPVSVQPLGR